LFAPRSLPPSGHLRCASSSLTGSSAVSAIAKEKNLVLVHTDKVLKDLGGFPQKSFRTVVEP
jgi:hypothetical protein